jgi:hypoxanthine phosphoribosyltransferase
MVHGHAPLPAQRYNASFRRGRPIHEGNAVSIEQPDVLISEDAIGQRVDELAARISADYSGKAPLVLVGVLKGSFIFLADLSRRLSIPRTIEFIAVSSYEEGSVHSGAVRLLMDVRGNIENKHVLIVEDIVDTGHTLHYLIGILQSHRPASVRTCALLHKADRAEVEVDIDYTGFSIPDEWVVGYGLDYAEQNRTLPYIGVIHPDH